MREGERPSVKRRVRTAAPRQLDARTLSIEVLTFFGNDPEEARQFFNASGVGVSDLRAVIEEPVFLSAALDYLMGDDRLLERFAEQAGLRPIDIAATAQAARERETWTGHDD